MTSSEDMLINSEMRHCNLSFSSCVMPAFAGRLLQGLGEGGRGCGKECQGKEAGRVLRRPKQRENVARAIEDWWFVERPGAAAAGAATHQHVTYIFLFKKKRFSQRI